ncbi:hypothetical protein ASPWEDRAFT_108047 [Aspergillus wentii DTO 134E9]|uniref:RGS domain-containing protein n=1 Tax=Aspergillus wentii DTO 134E9 TaxID=1073089 RepID=A0A1L9RP48_ASPWE|nr:uncharacterized protein ASPWEDRAFT_108047 [Aspergillus wentii DTO 134E9]OJJ36725.1 hypothetical protein ASPWEDRAFT_108047 [Aspergillus wentii DTO 134E9]
MLKKTLHPPLFFWNHTPTSTPELSPTSSSDSDSDEDMEYSAGSRPLSLSVPPGTFCPMRPSLDEVLANTAPAPYTLSAFMAYLSQNHCLETLEFTLEAKRYRETYDSIHQSDQSPIPADSQESQRLLMLWQRLLTSYIYPGSPREINLSSDVRDDILRLAGVVTPPSPNTLDVAVKLIHDLMEESIFLPFLNSLSSSAHVLSLGEHEGHGEGITVVSNSSLDEHAVKRVRSKSRARRLSPQSSSKELGSPLSIGSHGSHTGRSNFSIGSHGSHTGRSNFSLSAVASLGKAGSRTSGQISNASGDSGSAALTDDSGSNASTGEPMTPPTTPPSSDPFMQLGHSPKTRGENPWKKMGMKLGFKKRSTHGSNGNRDLRFSGMEE